MSTPGDGGRAKPVLMLAGGYPPDPQYPLRTLLFAKYLPRFGWEPVVLAPRGLGARPRVAAGAPGVVVRAPRLPLPTDVWRWLQAKSALRSLPAPAGISGPSRRGGVHRSLALWLETPDALAGWIPFAMWRGCAMARRLGVRAVYASGPPFSAVVSGLAIARLSGLPFVADFRDAWVLDPSDPFGALHGGFAAPRSERRVRLLSRLEERCLRGAAAVLFTSANTMADYVAHYPAIEERAHLILNGFDPEDFACDAPLLSPPTIAHVGTVHDYQWDQVRLVLSAFARTVSHSRLPQETRLCFVGPIGRALERRLDAAIGELGLQGRVLRQGAVSHGEAIRWMRGARLLLLLAGQNRHVRLSKISEYLAARRPILALAARGSATAEDVDRHGGRLLHDPSIDDLAASLAQELGTDSPIGAPSRTMTHPHPLNRITEAEQLAAILEGLPAA